MNKISIRNVKLEDAKAILDIYAPYILETAITFEYEVPSLEEFSERIKSISNQYPYIVAECEGKVVGYAYATTFKNRAAYDWCVETSVYIKRNERGKGIGQYLYEELEMRLRAMNVLNANACITYQDEEDQYLTHGSRKFHEKMGYRFVGRFHQCGYKLGKWYDMIWMEKMLGEHLPNPEKVLKRSL